MKSISLVCTIHKEIGHASVPALCSILERVRPEVIFLEVPPAALDQFLRDLTDNELESNSVRRYRESNKVELFPVDLPTPEERFFRDYQHLQERIDRPNSRRLLMWERNYIHDHGFAYLNSEHCSKMWSEIYADMRAVIETLNDQRLADIFSLWNKTNALREEGMLGNIQKYCREHSFEKGVFLVGAAHRQSIIDKSKVFCDGIQWDFSAALSPA